MSYVYQTLWAKLLSLCVHTCMGICVCLMHKYICGFLVFRAEIAGVQEEVLFRVAWLELAGYEWWLLGQPWARCGAPDLQAHVYVCL